MAGQWTTVKVPQRGGTFHADLMLLLTDGSVFVHNADDNPVDLANAKQWLRLRPDMTQSDPTTRYSSGIWSPIINMINSRQFFASGVIADGRVFVLGGEYSDDPASASDTPLAEVFEPQLDQWTAIDKPSSFDFIRGDGGGTVLADGRVLLGGASLTADPTTWSARTALWDPVNETWVEAGIKFRMVATTTKEDSCEEETWVLLPDGSVLAPAVRDTPKAQRYLPALDAWVDCTPSPQNLAIIKLKGVGVYETGPAILLPGGSVFVIGGNGQTALFKPGPNPTDPGSWTSGPAFPNDTTASPNWPTLTALDAPACLLPSGKVICVAGTTVPLGGGYFSINPVFLEYDPASAATTLPPLDAQPSLPSGTYTYQCWLLLLPTGQVLCSAQGDSLFLYTPDPAGGSPDPSWRPAHIAAPTTMVLGSTYRVTGTQINGLSQAVSYGDDGGMATNYPIVQLISVADGSSAYARSFNFSTLGVATGSAFPGDVQSCDIQVPAGLAPGEWDLVVIANGIASQPFRVTLAPYLSDRDSLYVADNDGRQILRFDSLNGVFLGAFDPSPDMNIPGKVVVNGNDVFVSGLDTNAVVRYTTRGDLAGTFVSPGSGGLDGPFGMDFGPDGDLYVSSIRTGEILRYDGKTGAFKGIFARVNDGGLDENAPTAVRFGPDGNLYVANTQTNARILRYEGKTGRFLGVFVANGSGGLFSPVAIGFGSDGNLYVLNDNSGSVLRYSGINGAFLDSFIHGLSDPRGLAIVGNSLYIGNDSQGQISRYDGTTGDLIEVLVRQGNGGLVAALDVTFGPSALG